MGRRKREQGGHKWEEGKEKGRERKEGGGREEKGRREEGWSEDTKHRGHLEVKGRQRQREITAQETQIKKETWKMERS